MYGRIRVALKALLVVALATCDGGGGDDAGVDTLAGLKRQVLANVGTEMAVARLDDFAEAASLLEAATAAHAAGPGPATLETARMRWVEAMAIWEELEIVLLGPGASGRFTGAMSLRDEIYPFPLLSTCRVDQETVEQVYEDPDAFAAENVNVRGLTALEYLLFNTSTENTCTAASPINTDGSWAALDAAEIEARRAVYAHTLAILVSRDAVRLREAWGDANAGFLRELSTAGDGSALFDTAQDALNELAGAMLYLDSMTKEMKIGEPAGIVTCTTGAMCLEELESRRSALSKEHIVINLRTFLRAFLGADPGTDAPGFDDLLAEVGQEALAQDIAAGLMTSIAMAEALEGTFEEAITNDPAGVQALHTQLGDVLRLFKTDVFTALDITLAFIPTDTD